MSRAKQLTFAGVALLVGIVIGIAGALVALRSSFPSQWFALVATESDAAVPHGNSVDVGAPLSVSYGEAAIVESDIATPSITSLSGKAKFLSATSTSGTSAPLGYVVDIGADGLDITKLPEKYRKEKVIQTKGGPLTAMPLEQATYEVHFVFRLLDRDGFQLLSLDSPKHTLESGKITHIQSQTQIVVPSRVAAHTRTIVLHLVIDKCLSATPD
ncbi:MAG: hypothetical protein ACJ8NS_04760 [Chthoniobacterales bacterium]